MHIHPRVETMPFIPTSPTSSGSIELDLDQDMIDDESDGGSQVKDRGLVARVWCSEEL